MDPRGAGLERSGRLVSEPLNKSVMPAKAEATNKTGLFRLFLAGWSVRVPTSGRRQWAMIVAVVAVRMVQMPIDEVIHMIAMRHGLVAAARPMDMSGRMAAACVLGCAGIRVRGGHGDLVLVDMIAVRVVKMAIVQVIDVALVHHCGMAASRSVLMVVVLVMGLSAGCHGRLLMEGCRVGIMRQALLHG